MRERIAAAARDATGRELRYERLDVRAPAAAPRGRGRAPRGRAADGAARARSASSCGSRCCRSSRAPCVVRLARGRAAPSSTLARTADGIELPIELPEDEPEPEAGAEAEERGAGGGGRGRLGRGARGAHRATRALTLVDRTRAARRSSGSSRTSTRARRGRIGSDASRSRSSSRRSSRGGALSRWRARSTPGGQLDVKLALADFGARAASARISRRTLALAASADLELALAGELEHCAGPLALDLTRRRDHARRRASGSPRASAPRSPGGLVRDGRRLPARGREARAPRRVRSRSRSRSRRAARAARRAALRRSQASAGWLPALAESGSTGSVALERARGRDSSRSTCAAASCSTRSSAPVGKARGLLTGRLEGQGDALVGERPGAPRSRSSSSSIAPPRRRPRGRAALRLRLASRAPTRATLVAGLSGEAQHARRPARRSTGDVSAPLSEPEAVLRAIVGRPGARTSTPGRLRGVSLLARDLRRARRAGPAGRSVRAGASASASRSSRRTPSRRSRGRFQIANGLARTDDLAPRLLATTSVDLAGVLGPRRSQPRLPGPPHALRAARPRARGGRERRGPGARREARAAARGVKGTLDAPRVVDLADRRARSSPPRTSRAASGAQKLERKLDERLGAGAGKPVLDLARLDARRRRAGRAGGREARERRLELVHAALVGRRRWCCSTSAAPRARGVPRVRERRGGGARDRDARGARRARDRLRGRLRRGACGAREHGARRRRARRARSEAAAARLAAHAPHRGEPVLGARAHAALRSAPRCAEPGASAASIARRRSSRRRGDPRRRTSRPAARSGAPAPRSCRTARASSPTATPARSRRAGYGTALGVVRAAVEAGRRVSVLADETRPFLQGARLTAWELAKDGIPVTVVTDGMAAPPDAARRGRPRDRRRRPRRRERRRREQDRHLRPRAPRARARHPVLRGGAAARRSISRRPTATRSRSRSAGATRWRTVRGAAVVPDGVPVRHPAFDVTPAALVTAIVTERGVAPGTGSGRRLPPCCARAAHRLPSALTARAGSSRGSTNASHAGTDTSRSGGVRWQGPSSASTTIATSARSCRRALGRAG